MMSARGHLQALSLVGVALAAAAPLAVLANGCSDGRSHAHAVCVLVDTSGTYADQRGEAVRLIKQGVLPELLPGDSLYVLRIDSNSYDQGNLWGLVTLSQRPSQANAQKAELARALDRKAQAGGRARYTDIQGGMMLCAEYLDESGAGNKTILVFSDMQEELQAGTRRRLKADELAGIRVLAMNVKRLQSDSADPTRYRQRLAAWQQTVTQHGASQWRVVMEPGRLVEELSIVH